MASRIPKIALFVENFRRITLLETERRVNFFCFTGNDKVKKSKLEDKFRPFEQKS